MPRSSLRPLFAAASVAVFLAGCASPPRASVGAGAQPAQLDAARFPEIDAASLSKVLATAPSVLKLAEEGRIDLDAKPAAYFPECANGGKDAITIRHLLTHSSGLPSGLPAKPAWHGDAAAHALACNQAVSHPPGTFFRYSDINYILLGQLVQKVSGMPLDEFARTRIFEPLQMRDTGYLPLGRMGAAQVPAALIAPMTSRAMPACCCGAANWTACASSARTACA